MLRMQDRARQGGHAGHETERAFRDKGSSVSDLGLFANSINLLMLLYGFSIHTLLLGIDDIVAYIRRAHLLSTNTREIFVVLNASEACLYVVKAGNVLMYDNHGLGLSVENTYRFAINI